jgi:hypothetical protein
MSDIEHAADGTQRSQIGGFLSTSNHLASPEGRIGVSTDQAFCWTVELKPDAALPPQAQA